MAKIFVSYNRESEVAVRALSADIEALGHDVWMDKELSGGQKWWDRILDVIRNTDVLVIALDPASLRSTACQSEWRYAATLNIPIMPVLTSVDVSPALLPPILSVVQHVDYTEPDKNSALRLARAFGSAPARGPLPDPMPEPPPAPMSYLSNVALQIRSSATLDYAQQSAILLDLENGIGDASTAEDCRTLLYEFSTRRDLLAIISKRIDHLKTQPSLLTRTSAMMPEPGPDTSHARDAVQQAFPPDTSDPAPHPTALNHVFDGLGFIPEQLDPQAEAQAQSLPPAKAISQKKQTEDLTLGLEEAASEFAAFDATQSSTVHQRRKSALAGAAIGLAIAPVLALSETAFGLTIGAYFTSVQGVFCLIAFTVATALAGWIAAGSNLAKFGAIAIFALILIYYNYADGGWYEIVSNFPITTLSAACIPLGAFLGRKFTYRRKN